MCYVNRATTLAIDSGRRTLPAELLVLQPVRNDAVLAEPAHLVLLIVLEIALEPFNMAVAFEGEDVRGDAIDRIFR